MQVLQKKKIVVNGTKKLHKTEMLKDELRGELKIKDGKKTTLESIQGL
jgi:hypothetical protein